jgi:hypothetical protein
MKGKKGTEERRERKGREEREEREGKKGKERRRREKGKEERRERKETKERGGLWESDFRVVAEGPVVLSLFVPSPSPPFLLPLLHIEIAADRFLL